MSIDIKLIFEIENDENLLSFRTEDRIPIYLMGKYYLLRDVIMCKALELSTSGNDRRVNKQAFRFVGKALCHNMLHKSDLRGKDIIFYTVCRPTVVDGKYFNRYTDYYTNLLKEHTGTIEQTAMDWTWPFPRNNPVIFDGIEVIKERITGKNKSKKDLMAVHDFIEYFNERLEMISGLCLSDDECRIASERIALLISSIRDRAKWLDRILPHNTKILISTGGSYPHYYPINKMLRERGILSADLQHGFITSTNLMYNYAPALANSEVVKEGSSDYFLTYGDWWNTQINGPSKKVSIGNPYRDGCVNRIDSLKKGNRILLIGCEINTEQYIRLALELSKILPEYEVVFRPHPGEVKNTLRLMEEKNIDIQLDTIKELYESLDKTSVVVSEVSTVLFEAIGIVDDIIVLNTAYSQSYLPEHPFSLCNNAQDILKVIRNPQKNDYGKETFWAADWEHNYQKFLSDIGIEK